tara:strand:+ start:1016 stop:1144 length:129 start_codon:yes stop_codon:yes gene_type:complete
MNVIQSSLSFGGVGLFSIPLHQEEKHNNVCADKIKEEPPHSY